MKIDPFDPYGTIREMDDDVRSAAQRRRVLLALGELRRISGETNDAFLGYTKAMELRNALVRELRAAGVPNVRVAAALGMTEMTASRLGQSEEPTAPAPGQAFLNTTERQAQARMLAWRAGTVAARHLMQQSYREALELARAERNAPVQPQPVTPEEHAANQAEYEAWHKEGLERAARWDEWIEKTWEGIVAEHEARLTPTLPDADAHAAS